MPLSQWADYHVVSARTYKPVQPVDALVSSCSWAACCSSKRWRRAARFTGDIIISGGLVLLIIPHGQGITRVALMRNQGPRATSCTVFIRSTLFEISSLSVSLSIEEERNFSRRDFFFFFKNVNVIYILRCFMLLKEVIRVEIRSW